MISNDGATILKQMEVLHPTAKMVRRRIEVTEEGGRKKRAGV